MPSEFVHDVLTVMHSCGMYDYAGHWSHEVGISAMSGGVRLCHCGGAGTNRDRGHSPRLDAHGNSVRAIMACRKISADFGLHVFRGGPGAASVFTAGTRRVVRPAAEHAILDRSAGPFASSRRIIVDFRYVQRADQAAARLLEGLAAVRANPAIPLIYSHLPNIGPLSSLRPVLNSKEAGDQNVLVFEGLNAALEYVENQILDLHHPAAPDATLSLPEMAIFKNLKPEEMRLLIEEVNPKPVVFEKGQTIFRRGEIGTVFFAIARGAVAVELPPVGPSLRTVQLALMGKGLTFGELALIDGQTRAAHIVAESELACYGIAVDALRAFGQRHPAIYAKILMNLIQDLADKLRFANEAVHALEGL